METMLSFPTVTVNYKDQDSTKRFIVRSSVDAYKAFSPVFTEFMQHHEEFWAIYLNRGNKILGMSCIGKGGINGAVVDVRIILQTALLTNSSSIIIAHNHPGGTLCPSIIDKNVTKKIYEACKIMDMNLFDHIVLGDSGYYSFRDEGLIH